MNKEQYQEYLKSDHWKELKGRKLASVKVKRCAICGATEDIHTHHLQYRNIFDVQLSDLRFLCERCHSLAHDLMKSGKLIIKSKSHHGIFAATKAAVKKALGLTGKNLFAKGRLPPSP